MNDGGNEKVTVSVWKGRPAGPASSPPRWPSSLLQCCMACLCSMPVSPQCTGVLWTLPRVVDRYRRFLHLQHVSKDRTVRGDQEFHGNHLRRSPHAGPLHRLFIRCVHRRRRRIWNSRGHHRAILAGLGFNALYAAGICFLANTAPVAFGAIGMHIVVGAGVSGVDLMAFSQMDGRTLPFLSVFDPLYLVILMACWKKGIEVSPACLGMGGCFAVVEFLSSNYIEPCLPDILSSIAFIVATVFFLHLPHLRESRYFSRGGKGEGKAEFNYTGGQVFRAWAPFVFIRLRGRLEYQIGTDRHEPDFSCQAAHSRS